MTHPEVIYYAGLMLACPLILFSRIAGILVCAGAAACMAWLSGLPMAPVYLVIHITGAAIGIRCWQTSACMMILVMFIPLAVADVLEMAGAMTAEGAWWARYWLVLAQLALLPSCVDWGHVRKTIIRVLDALSDGAWKMISHV